MKAKDYQIYEDIMKKLSFYFVEDACKRTIKDILFSIGAILYCETLFRNKDLN